MIWTAAAADHLDEIVDYIAQERPDTAIKVLAKILDSVAHLETFPGMGRTGKLPHSREHVVPGMPYIVVYRVRGDDIVVLAVFHGARDWPPPPLR